MGNYSFWKDLQEGKKIEKEAAFLLKNRLQADSVEFNNDYKFDFVLKKGDRARTYEVKNDTMCGQTGNFALEYEYKGKSSGIMTSEADYWIYKLDDGFYLASTESLKSLITEEKYFRIVVGGDKGSNTKMYLFKLPFIKSQMLKLN